MFKRHYISALAAAIIAVLGSIPVWSGCPHCYSLIKAKIVLSDGTSLSGYTPNSGYHLGTIPIRPGNDIRPNYFKCYEGCPTDQSVVLYKEIFEFKETFGARKSDTRRVPLASTQNIIVISTTDIGGAGAVQFLSDRTIELLKGSRYGKYVFKFEVGESILLNCNPTLSESGFRDVIFAAQTMWSNPFDPGRYSRMFAGLSHLNSTEPESQSTTRLAAFRRDLRIAKERHAALRDYIQKPEDWETFDTPASNKLFSEYLSAIDGQFNGLEALLASYISFFERNSKPDSCNQFQGLVFATIGKPHSSTQDDCHTPRGISQADALELYQYFQTIKWDTSNRVIAKAGVVHVSNSWD